MLQTTYNPSTKSFFGPESNVPLYSNRASLGLLALHSLRLNPEKVIQICAEDDSRMTAKELQRDILQVATNLKKSFGLGLGDVIGIVARNTKYLPAVVLGALSIGAPISPLDPSLTSSEIAHLFSLTRPKVIVCDGDVAQRVRAGLCSLGGSEIPVIIIHGGEDQGNDVRVHYDIKDLLKEDESGQESFWPSDLGNTDYLIGAILASSGSTGPPKAVAITQTILKYYAVYSDYNITAQDTRLSFSNLNWYTGIISLISPIFKCSPRVVTTAPFSPQLAIKLILKYEINYIVGPASQITFMSEYLKLNPVTLPTLKQVDIGGCLANIQHIRHFAKFLPNGRIGNFYGMTEFFGLLGRKLDVSDKYCVGQLLTDCEVKILNENGDSMGVNEKGEIHMKPWFPCLGYYNNGVLSKDFLTADGFIKSGDIGFFDAEGDLHIVDRIKETFKCYDFQVSPSEIENVILKLDGVLMAQVVGIAVEDGINMLATAFIVKDKTSEADVTAEMINKTIQSHLSRPKWLHGGVYFLESFPTTVSGKVSKRLLREWVEAHKK